MLVFIDETGTDRRDSFREFGYSLHGRRTRAHRLIARGQHVSAISDDGILECQFYHGAVTGETFYSFIENSLLPHLMPFNGTNEHSVVIMDNASIHHIEGISELITSAGAFLIYQPPYSPDLNPLEKVFSSIKSYLKANEALLQVTDDIETILLQTTVSAFTNISSDGYKAWVNLKTLDMNNCSLFLLINVVSSFHGR